MKSRLLIAASILSLSGSIAPSLADTSSGNSDPSATNAGMPVTTNPASASLAAPLRPAIVTPAVVTPTPTVNGTDRAPRRHLRIGLPGLFHVNLD